MAEEPQRPKRTRTRRQGRSLDWTERDIEQAAKVGPEDADAAEVSWNKYSRAPGLLSAVEASDDDR